MLAKDTTHLMMQIPLWIIAESIAYISMVSIHLQINMPVFDYEQLKLADWSILVYPITKKWRLNE